MEVTHIMDHEEDEPEAEDNRHDFSHERIFFSSFRLIIPIDHGDSRLSNIYTTLPHDPDE